MNTDLMPPRAAQTGREMNGMVAVDVTCVPTVMVNTYLVGNANVRGSGWVLVDAGLPLSAGKIRRAAESRFGKQSRPTAIILTHGHFDHVGSLKELAEAWDVPVYAHELELPYLTGRSSYPPADPTVGGGLMARLGWMFPTKPIDLGHRVRPLPSDGSIPGMPGWRWIHTPGHSPGHVSLFRDSDRALIAGDAFTTQKQESFWGVLTRYQKLHGPPKYFTTDWNQACDSVNTLAALRPEYAGTGHGIPMTHPQLSLELNELARHFDVLAVPDDGRYVRQPAISDEGGVEFIPPPVSDPKTLVVAVIAGVAVVAGLTMLLRSRARR